MIHHTANGNDWYIVPVPKEAECIRFMQPTNELSYIVSFSAFNPYRYIQLPCECKIHAITSEITEEQAAEMVTNEGKQVASYTDYTDPLKGHKTAKESLQSLLTEHGIEHAVILKKP